MTLSFPIAVLKSQARRLRRDEGLPLHQALDRIAAREGYPSWSLLVARARRSVPLAAPGTLLLVAGRPGHGKTRRACGLLVDALRVGQPSWYVALHNERSPLRAQFDHHGADLDVLSSRLTVLASDTADADTIARSAEGAQRGSVVVVDYLQVLDQCRSAPPLDAQLECLRHLARRTGACVVLLAQVSRAFEGAGRAMPGPHDIRQLNPFDLSWFDRMLFLHDGKEQRVDPRPH